MRTLILLSVGILVLVMGCTTDQSEEIAQLKEKISHLEGIVNPPPGSLENLYPPKAEAPILLLKMFELGTSLSGIGVNIFENDLEHVSTHFEKFKAQYAEVSKLVPEWEKAFPIEPIEELGAAFESGDQENMMAAFEKVGKVCSDCHIVNMTRVQQKYHWDDFSGISVADPVTNEELDFKQLMQYLDLSFGGISVDLEEGQPENALKHFEAFKGRFQVMKETCEVCHETERKYYVDENVQALIDRLGAALRSASPDQKLVVELSQGIGMESCLKCHWVHMPAAITKARWQEGKKIENK